MGCVLLLRLWDLCVSPRQDPHVSVLQGCHVSHRPVCCHVPVWLSDAVADAAVLMARLDDAAAVAAGQCIVVATNAHRCAMTHSSAQTHISK